GRAPASRGSLVLPAVHSAQAHWDAVEDRLPDDTLDALIVGEIIRRNAFGRTGYGALHENSERWEDPVYSRSWGIARIVVQSLATDWNPADASVTTGVRQGDHAGHHLV